jgi:hypothetical protein
MFKIAIIVGVFPGTSAEQRLNDLGIRLAPLQPFGT